jgi:hypothetical protein
MPRDVRCDCGYELHLPDEEARELTWCPRCRKVLIRPAEYAVGQRRFTTGAGTPSGGRGGRLATGIAVGIVLLVARAACVSTTHYDAPRYEVPDLAPSQFKFDPPQFPGFPPQDRDRMPPEWSRPPDDRNPFLPEKEPPDNRDGRGLPERDPDPDP